MLAESNQHILLYYFLISPTDDDYAVSLFFTQLGQFRPQYTTITGLRLRVLFKSQIFDFQGFAIFLLDFAPLLRHEKFADCRSLAGYRVHFYRKTALGTLFFQGIKSSSGIFLHYVNHRPPSHHVLLAIQSFNW